MSSKKGTVLPNNNQLDISSFKTKNIYEILCDIEAHCGGIYQAVARTFGIDAWFSAYILSDEFYQIPDEYKREALKAFNDVRLILITIGKNQRDMD